MSMRAQSTEYLIWYTNSASNIRGQTSIHSSWKQRWSGLVYSTRRNASTTTWVWKLGSAIYSVGASSSYPMIKQVRANDMFMFIV